MCDFQMGLIPHIIQTRRVRIELDGICPVWCAFGGMGSIPSERREHIKYIMFVYTKTNERKKKQTKAKHKK